MNYETLSKSDKAKLDEIYAKRHEITAELRALFDPDTVKEIMRTSKYLSSLTEEDIFDPINGKYHQAIEDVLSELNAVGTPKPLDNGCWPIESTRGEISTRNPGIYFFLQMDKKDKNTSVKTR